MQQVPDGRGYVEGDCGNERRRGGWQGGRGPTLVDSADAVRISDKFISKIINNC
jgi:hypothetical protein